VTIVKCMTDDHTELMVRTVFCPECLSQFWLTDDEFLALGLELKQSPAQQPISFACCGKVQTVSAASVVFTRQKLNVAARR
jgi:hypothetical protein